MVGVCSGGGEGKNNGIEKEEKSEIFFAFDRIFQNNLGQHLVQQLKPGNAKIYF